MMHHRLFVLPFLFLSPLACAELVAPTGDQAAGTGGSNADPGDEMEDGSDDPKGTGGVVIIVAGTGGISALGGAPSTGGSSDGPTGPVLLPNCDEASDCDDRDPCTDDECNNGQCAHFDNGTCECTPKNSATTCVDDNECTDNACVDNKCVVTNNSNTCTDDANACTSDLCDAGECTHLNAGVCTANTVILRSVRDGNAGQWVTLTAAGTLVWNVATTLGAGALFERVAVTETTFKLKVSTGDTFVTLDASDNLVANATEETAAIFSAPTCPLVDSAGVGLEITTDDDGGNFAAAEPGGTINARSGGCNSGSAAAWERFEILPAGG